MTVYRQLHIPVRMPRPGDAAVTIHDEATFDRDMLWLVLYDFAGAL